MKNIIAFLSLSIVFCCQQVFANASPSFIDKTMKSFMQQYQIPGAAVAIIDHGKSSIYVYGYANMEKKEPISRQTIFEVGSITKLLTTLLLSEEVKNQQLQLSNSLTQYLPEFRGNLLLKGITLENLATYSSGLPFNAPELIKTPKQLQDYLMHWQPTEGIGSRWQYSNMGIGLLGSVLQNKNHKEINNLYRERILAPLHMSLIGLEIPQALQKNQAQGYTDKGKPDVHLPLGLFPSAGAMKANIQDMSHFLVAAIGLPEAPINIRQAMEFSQTPRLQVGDMQQAMAWQVYPLEDKNKLVAPENMNLDSLPVKWLSKDKVKFNPNALIDKTGATYGFRAYIAVIPGQESGIVILTNRYVSNGAIVNTGRHILFALK